jgi:competence protein ComEA
VTDGQQIYVPRQGEDSPPVQPPSAQRSSDFRVNINTADAMTLQTLPGIGPKLAQRILDYRAAHGPFARTQDIMEVSGIGQATFEELDDQITTE